MSDTWRLVKFIPSRSADGYKEHALAACRHEVGAKLYDLIYKLPQPVAVEIEEEITSQRFNDNYGQMGVEIVISVYLSAIQRNAQP